MIGDTNNLGSIVAAARKRMRREKQIQQLAKYILLSEYERTGIETPDLPGAIQGAFIHAEAFEAECEARMRKAEKP